MGDDFENWLSEREKEDPEDSWDMLRPGQRIGAYRILRQLGVGGMGQVYEAEHVALGVRRALKVFSTESEHSEFLRKRFVAEGRILADLQHPRIVRVYDLVVDEDSGTAYFEMDLVLSPDGQPRTLADELQDGVDEEKVVGWFKDICEGLAYIHSQGVVHRDISLDNILIGRDERAVITDFGIAKIIDDSYRKKIDVTVTMVYKDGSEVRIGKERYMAPELKKPNGRASFATDAWALGVLLFRMLSGSWYDVGTRLEDWHADLKYDWHPLLSRLFNPEPENRLGAGGIAALPTLLNRRSHSVTFSRRKWIIACEIVALIFILLLIWGYLGVRDGKVYEGCQYDAVNRRMSNWEIVEPAMSPFSTSVSSLSNTNASKTILRLTESVQSNFWMTTLHSDVGLLENGQQSSYICLTLNPNIQYETEEAVKWGLSEYGAAVGWAIVMDAKTGAIYAMVSHPDLAIMDCDGTSDFQKINRAVGFSYEPGLVMAVITVAAAMDSHPKYDSKVCINTNKEDPAYYRLPSDGSHQWEPRMTLADAVGRSSNIVIGKVAYDVGPYILYNYMRLFGFGAKTGIELSCEESGILPDPHRVLWDKTKWSRIGVGQGVTVTAIQLVSAYQAIANDGIRMKPYIIDRICDDGMDWTLKQKPMELGRVISDRTARELRDMMTGVLSKDGTAPFAAIKGYSVAGKTGTAPKVVNGRYSDSLFRATFCGIVPAYKPQLVILVTLDFDEKRKSHRGGNSSGPVFRRIALAAIRYLAIHPDKLDELDD